MVKDVLVFFTNIHTPIQIGQQSSTLKTDYCISKYFQDIALSYNSSALCTH